MTQKNGNGFESVERWFVIALTVWAACVFIAARSGLISSLPRMVLGPLILAATATPILVYYLNKRFRAYISSIDLKHLTIFHLWRLLAGFTFVAYGSQQLLPHVFVRNAGYGDILVGLLVPVVLVLPWSTGKYIAFHTIGLIDFILAVGTGITLTLQQVPLMWNITAYPVILIPLLGVPISGSMHIMALDIAWKRHQQKVKGVGLPLHPEAPK